MSNTSCDNVPETQGASLKKKKFSRRHSAHADRSKEAQKEESQGKLKKMSSLKNSTARGRRRKTVPSHNDVDLLSASLSSSTNVLERFKTLSIDEQIALKRAAKEQAALEYDDSSSSASFSSGYNEFSKNRDREALMPPSQIWAQSSKTSSYSDLIKESGPVKMASKESSSDRHLCTGSFSSDYEQTGIDITAELKVPGFEAQQCSKASMGSVSAGYAEKTTVKNSEGAALDSYEERLKRKLAEGSSGNSGRSIYKSALATTWSCSKCTYVNRMSFSACEMCKEPKEVPMKKSDSAYACSSIPGVCFIPGSNSRNGWKCTSCTYLNTGTRSSCEVCGASR